MAFFRIGGNFQYSDYGFALAFAFGNGRESEVAAAEEYWLDAGWLLARPYCRCRPTSKRTASPVMVVAPSISHNTVLATSGGQIALPRR